MDYVEIEYDGVKGIIFEGSFFSYNYFLCFKEDLGFTWDVNDAVGLKDEMKYINFATSRGYHYFYYSNGDFLKAYGFKEIKKKTIRASITTDLNIEVPSEFSFDDVEELIIEKIVPSFIREVKGCKIIDPYPVEFDWNVIEENENKNEIKINTMKNLVISLEKARELYKNGSEEMRNLLLESFTEDELVPKQLPKNWEEFVKDNEGMKVITSWHGNVGRSDFDNEINKNSNNIYPNEKYLKSARAFSKLSFLIERYNDGWHYEFDEEDEGERYYSILYSYSSKILYVSYFETSKFNVFVFKSKEIAKEFLKNFDALIKEYLMIY